jgi:hypothetical protein
MKARLLAMEQKMVAPSFDFTGSSGLDIGSKIIKILDS